jgi:hypothetical protein
MKNWVYGRLQNEALTVGCSKFPKLHYIGSSKNDAAGFDMCLFLMSKSIEKLFFHHSVFINYAIVLVYLKPQTLIKLDANC